MNQEKTNGKKTSVWGREEMEKIAQSDDLHIAPFREDGATYGTLTWIWSVVVDNELYVRPYNGSASRWYQAAMSQRAGRITAACITKEVSFVPADASLYDEIDEAYRTKYKGSPYLQPMLSANVRNATVKISPRMT
jgi:hypothetical protein